MRPWFLVLWFLSDYLALVESFTNLKPVTWNMSSSTSPFSDHVHKATAKGILHGKENSLKPSSRRARFKEKIQSSLSTLKGTQLVPVISAFAVGYKVGARAVAKTAKVASDVSSKTTTSQPNYALMAVVTAVAFREVWRLIPAWLKRQIPYLGSRYAQSDKIDPNDMTNVSNIAAKLQSLFQNMSNKLSSDDSTVQEDEDLRPAFLATLQLIAQVKEQEPKKRDQRYLETGRVLEVPYDELKDMEQYFEFADWAYDEIGNEVTVREALRTVNYTLLRHEIVALPGSVANYVAISKATKTALIGIKGTSNFEDMLTDCCGNSVAHELPDGKEIRCHEGILLAAQRLAEDLEDMIEELFLPNNYNILVTGHSLGAGTAALLGVLLRAKFPELRNTTRLKVLAFAPPPVLDHDSALECKDFVTSIINNSDIIPRASLSNLLVMTEFARRVNEKLDEKGLLPKNARSSAAFLRFLANGKDGDMLMTVDEVLQAMDDAYERVELRDPSHLYVPGRVLHMFDLWSKTGYGEIDEEIEELAKGDAGHHSNTPVDPETNILYGGDFEVPPGHKTAEHVIESDGTSKVLRYIELDMRMLTDHLSPGYRTSIRSLLRPDYKGTSQQKETSDNREKVKAE